MPPLTPARLAAPVTARMHQDYTRLPAGQTVAEALAGLRNSPPPGRVIYFYVVDGDGRLQGVVPTRRLLLAAPETPVADIMVRQLVAVPAEATVLEACEFFIQHRFLAFPVVDADNRLLGVIDVDLYTEELAQIDQATPLGRFVTPLRRFMEIEAAGGVVLMIAAAAALVIAQSPLAEAFAALWKTPVAIHIGPLHLADSLKHLVIDDGLMTLFFFVVGLEIKRELVSGELADPRKALLPIVAALGGMLAPALVYTVVRAGQPGGGGWPVPTATDIAFVVGVLTLLGPRVPAGLKIMLLTLAIADDIGAVVLIAVVFPKDLAVVPLLVAAGGLGLVVALRVLGARSVGAYVVVGAGIWLAFLKSGVHPTVAGVALGLMTPARPLLRRRVLLDVVGELYDRLRGHEGEVPAPAEGASPVERLEEALHPWVAFGIMPLFALASAGVTLQLDGLTTPVSLAVAAGLVVGKPIGIFLFSWASVRLGLTRLPAGVSWPALAGAGCLGGIGFTMSLFMAGLAFEGDAGLHDHAKVGILAGSVISGVVGSLVLLAALPRGEVKDEG